MKYMAFYRKYRPKTFNDIVGQKIIVEILQNAIKNNKLSHAYLFSGPRGSGKTSLAKLFAKTINCENLENNNPCENCKACTSINESSASDVIEIDAASNNGVEEIREIRSKISLVPNVCKYKVYIIDEVHMLSIGAFNALLKTLEEPPEHIVFILATTEPQKIPETIISRCQRYDFKRVNEKSIVERLKYIAELEKISIDDESLKALALSSNGGLRDAIGYLEQAALLGNNKVTTEIVSDVVGTITKKEIEIILDNFNNNKINELLSIFELHYANGKNVIRILETVLEYLKNEYYEEKSSISYDNLMIFAEIYEKTLTSKNPLIKLQAEILLNKKNKTVENDKIEVKKIISQEINKEEKETEIEDSKKTTKKETEEIILNCDYLEELINTRVNNALFNADKNVLQKLKKKTAKIESYSMDRKFSKISSLLCDSQLVVAGKNNLLFATKYKTIADRINKDILLAEDLLEECFATKYKTIVITDKEWKNHKEDYVKKINENKKYEYIQEDKKYFEKKKKEKDDIIDVFSDIIEIK